MSRYSPALVLLAALALVGCGGGTASLKNDPAGSGSSAPGSLAISSGTIDFGNVVLGSSSTEGSTLTAKASAITISSASWSGQGYSLSGVTFPVTLMAGQSAPFSVTFAPQGSGTVPGSISFISNASNSPTTETFTGKGIQAVGHSVSLSWSPSPSAVIGYNVYRGTTSGGPYPARLTSTPQPMTSLIDSGVVGGTTYYYVATSVDQNSVESVFSNQITATVP
jgi:hypothetical protein